MNIDKSKTHFVLIGGFSSDHLGTMGLKKSLEKIGYSADAISFYGEKYINDFTDLKISDCIANVSGLIDRCAEQYEKVFGIGISLGGALLMEHAKRSDNLKGIASIGTPFRLNNRALMNFGQKILPTVYLLWRRMQKIKWLRLHPIGAANMIIEYLETDFLKGLDFVKIPILLLHSKKDQISDCSALPEYLDLISSERKKITFFHNGDHVISHDPDSIIEYYLDFLGLDNEYNL